MIRVETTGMKLVTLSANNYFENYVTCPQRTRLFIIYCKGNNRYLYGEKWLPGKSSDEGSYCLFLLPQMLPDLLSFPSIFYFIPGSSYINKTTHVSDFIEAVVDWE